MNIGILSGLTAIGLLLASLAPAQTEVQGPAIPVLFAGGRIYSNAWIVHTTPAYAVIEYSGGTVQVPMGEMPRRYREQFHYSRAAANRFLAAERQQEKRTRALTQEEQAAYERFVLSLAGTNRPIRIEAVGNEVAGGLPLCAARDIPRGILIKFLPDEVKSYLNEEANLRATVAAWNRRVAQDRIAISNAMAATPVGGLVYLNTPASALPQPAQDLAILRHDQAQLERSENALSKLESEAPRRAVVDAFPARQSYAGHAIWICTGLAANRPGGSPSPG